MISAAGGAIGCICMRASINQVYTYIIAALYVFCSEFIIYAVMGCAISSSICMNLVGCREEGLQVITYVNLILGMVACGAIGCVAGGLRKRVL